jgi:hypothetical protein
MDNHVLISLKKIFNNDDIIDKIYNYYILDKYFSKKLNYTSTKIFKQFYLKNDFVFLCSKIINPHYLNIYFIKKMLISDNVISIFLNNIPTLIQYLPYRYKNDKKLMLLLCKKDRIVIRYASKELRSDYDFINELIDFYPSVIYYASDKLKDNYELALKCVKTDGDTIEYISQRLRNNIEILTIANKNKLCYY